MHKRIRMPFFISMMIILMILPACHHQSTRQETATGKTDSLPKPDRSVEGSFSDQKILYLDMTKENIYD